MSESVTAPRTPTLHQLSRKLTAIGKIEKCEGCGCYVDTIKEFDAFLQQTRVDGTDAQSAREVIDELNARHTTTHGCIGCDPCYPVVVSNVLYALSDGESVEAVEPSESEHLRTECGVSSCDCDAPDQETPTSPKTGLKADSSRPAFAWPIEAGDYRVGNQTGCVAIATLASEELYQHFSESICDEACAICGKVFTENIGIEKAIKNIIANPHIRFLVLCGPEAKGHLTGACIKALHANGLDDRRRIAEAPGKRPWMKTLTATQVTRFQEQVEVIDLIGCEDQATIERHVRDLAERNPGAMPEAMLAEGVPRYLARDAVKLKLDKAGFFIIHPKPEANWIMVEHYRNTGEPTCIIEGTDPAKICAEIIGRGLMSQLDHAAYLGRELERAKLSMQLRFPFVQDRAFGELGNEDIPEW